MNSLRQIFEQAQRNNATNGLSWKEYKNAMKQAGVTNRQLFLKNPEARKKANELFYGTPEVTVPSIFSLGQVKNFTPKPIKPEPEDIVEEEEIIVEPPKTNITHSNYWQNIARNSKYFKDTDEVAKFQQKQGLTVDGKLGQQTINAWNKLNPNQQIIIKTENPGENESPREVKSDNDFSEQNKKQEEPFFSWKQLWNTFLRTSPIYGIFNKQNQGIISKAFSDSSASSLFKQGGKMTYKFQQGGQASSQDAVMQFVQALAQTLQADPNQVIQAAQQNPEALKSAVQVYQQTQDIQQAAQAFSQALQSQAQAAKHGAKLNYLKALKNQCAEDEELVYFKKGGKVDCGCVKKTQEGGKAPKKESPVMKFKKTIKSKDQAVKDSTKLDPKTTKTLPNGKYPSNWTADDKITWEREHGPKDEGAHIAREQKCGGKMKKDCGGSKLKKGDKVCPKCGKVHAAGAGCMLSPVKKFKMHKQGGSLNEIPFYQKGTTEGGIKQYPEDEFSGWDLVPFVGTARDIRRAYHNPNVQTIGTAAVSTAADIIGGGMLGAFGKGLLKSAKFAKKLKRLGYVPITENGNTYFKIGTKMKTPTTSSINIEPSIPTVSVHNIPAVDYTPVVNTMIAPVGRVSNYALWGVPTQK